MSKINPLVPHPVMALVNKFALAQADARESGDYTEAGKLHRQVEEAIAELSDSVPASSFEAFQKGYNEMLEQREILRSALRKIRDCAGLQTRDDLRQIAWDALVQINQ